MAAKKKSEPKVEEYSRKKGTKDFANQDWRAGDFTNTDFVGSDFTGAILQGANFTGSTFKDCKFDGADVRWAINFPKDIEGVIR